MTIYNVLLNSNNRVVGTTTASATYYFDWSVLEDARYLLTWGFVCSNIDATTPKLGLVSANLGQCNVFLATSVNTRATTTNILGTVIPNEAGVSFLYGDINTNQPILLNRPQNNEFNVTIRTIDGLEWTDSVLAPIPEYSLSLNFEKI